MRLQFLLWKKLVFFLKTLVYKQLPKIFWLPPSPRAFFFDSHRLREPFSLTFTVSESLFLCFPPSPRAFFLDFHRLWWIFSLISTVSERFFFQKLGFLDLFFSTFSPRWLTPKVFPREKSLILAKIWCRTVPWEVFLQKCLISSVLKIHSGRFYPKLVQKRENLSKILVKSPTVHTKIPKIGPFFQYLFATMAYT